MIRFLYGLPYPSGGSKDPFSSLLLLVRLYGTADKYLVPAATFWVVLTAPDIFRHFWSKEFANGFATIIEKVYDITPSGDRGLRAVVVRATYDHLRELMAIESFVQVLQENTAFAKDILTHVAQQKPSGSCEDE